MTWLLFALMQPLLNSIVNLVDKFLISKRIKNIYSYGIIIGILTLLTALIVWNISKPQNPKAILVGLIVGGIYGSCYFIYWHLFKYAEASRVMGMIYLYPAIVVILSRITLDEKINIIKHAAIALTIIGAIMLGIENTKRWKLSHSFWLSIVIAIIIGLVDTTDKYLLQYLTPLQIFSITYTGTGAVLLLGLLNKNARKDLKQAMQSWHVIIPTGMISLTATFFFLLAAKQVQVAIVLSMATLQPALVFIGTLIISTFKPHIIKETLKPKLVIYKALGILLVVAGAAILAT